MKNIKIKILKIANFKGIKKLELTFNDIASYLRGENATGKSTVDDAINYLLRGKNANGDADTNFSIKPLDDMGNEIHRLETLVDGVLDINGMDREFKKVYKEKWVKKNGTDEQIFSGNTVDYYVDGIKQKTKKAYEQEVNDIFGVESTMLVMLSNPLYFMSQMEWTERRAILCQMAGDINYSDIIQDSQFNDLRSELDLEKHKPDAFKKHCRSQVKDIDEQKEKIPTQLQVLDDQDADILTINFDDVEKKIALNETAIKEAEEKIKTLSDDTAENEIKIEFSKRITNLQTQGAELREKLNTLTEQKENKLDESLQEVRELLSNKNNDLDNATRTLTDMERSHTAILSPNGDDEIKLQNTIVNRDALRGEFAKVDAEKFTLEQDTFCPACKREYGADYIGNIEDETRKAFDGQIKLKKENIRKDGKRFNEAIEKLEKDIALRNNQAEEIWKTVISQKSIVAGIEKEVVELESSLKNTKCDTLELDKVIEETKGAMVLLGAKIKEIESERDEKLKSLTDNSVAEAKKELENTIVELKKSIKELNETLSHRGSLVRNEKQRNTYLNTEKELNQKHEYWSRMEFLTAQLIKAYMSKVEDNVNSLFTLVKFKLFEEQQNGGEREVCIPTVLGVPHGDLNTAKYINAGIDIINALCIHYGVRAPIVIDNRESITNIIDTESQIINLIKDSDYPVLTQTDK